ncbi:MAG TPA: DUF930 domain-containing protein [Pseudolabrys sp.]|jgi:hypothetical protein|nr:DUF930 domain-containing protein [Pseudolabrys sp.]
MRAFGLAVVAAVIITAAAAADERFERSLTMLAPAERLEQLCDYTAMTRIRAEKKEFRPDRAVANAMAEPRGNGDTLEVTGGAIRSKKKWYALTYRCSATPDHLKIVTFSYAIGEEIPEAKWASFGLWQ